LAVPLELNFGVPRFASPPFFAQVMNYREAQAATVAAQLEIKKCLALTNLFPTVIDNLIAAYTVIPKSYIFPIRLDHPDGAYKICTFKHEKLGDMCIVSSFLGDCEIYAASHDWELLFKNYNLCPLRGMAIWKTKLIFADYEGPRIHSADISSQDIGEWHRESSIGSYDRSSIHQFTTPIDVEIIGDQCLILDLDTHRVKCYTLALDTNGIVKFSAKSIIQTSDRESPGRMCIDQSGVGFITTQNGLCMSVIDLSTQTVRPFLRRDDFKENKFSATCADGILYIVSADLLQAFDIKTLKVVRARDHEFTVGSCVSVNNRWLFFYNHYSITVMHLDELLE
jgi:hypothetical protein